ncbi:ATP-dependent DNA helicase, partial [Enterococcus faecium]|nr:ATP-dependent DNA helicase [Enterococcus faecium]
VLFSPNKLYSRYISDVLPSLGERNMRQLTLAEFFSRRLEGMQVQTLFDRFENQHQLTEYEQNLIDFKESQDFIELIQAYEKQLSAKEIKFTNINYRGEIFFSKEQIQAIFETFPLSMSNKERLLKTKNALIKLLQKRVNQEIKQDWVQNQIDQ